MIPSPGGEGQGEGGRYCSSSQITPNECLKIRHREIYWRERRVRLYEFSVLSPDLAGRFANRLCLAIRAIQVPHSNSHSAGWLRGRTRDHPKAGGTSNLGVVRRTRALVCD